MSYSLWFRNSNGVERIIARVENWYDVHRSINDFINQCNESKPENKRFKSYYTRSWKEPDGRTILDVGSWSEFFLTDVPREE